MNYTKAKIFNGYGPTEITACCTNKLVESKNITIGKPIDNVNAYICDRDLKLLPIGVIGEICIAGNGVSQGYLNNIELTDQKFIDNPFGNGKMYRTGDLGKFNNDGEIEYIGRLDNQVKIRGLRIELGEIEDKIREIPLIDSCTVIKRIDSNHREYLCAYYIQNDELEINDIRKHLEKALPKYMIPQYFVKMEEMPVTHNGKIDTKRLPEPEYRTIKTEIVLPRNEIDSELIELLKELLSVDNISINDNFFDLGGDSLSAINLSIRIQDEFNVKLYVKDILEHPVIKDISDNINKNQKTVEKQIIKRVIEEEL